MPLVKIKPGLHHAQYSAGDVFDASPAEVVSFGDKFILVEKEDTPTAIKQEIVTAKAEAVSVDATPSARALAEEHGISLALSILVGSGKDGRITKTDVAALLLNSDAEVVLNGDAQR